MGGNFDDRWNEAMAHYEAALADCDKAAEEITEAQRGGFEPDSTSLSEEKRARTQLFDARKTVLVLLRERKTAN